MEQIKKIDIHAHATPFAKYIFNGADGATSGIYETERGALNAIGIDIQAIEVRSESELITALTKKQKMIIFGEDIILHDTVIIPYDLTIDLNGHALHQMEPNKGIFEIEDDITLNIIDKYSEAYRHTFKAVNNYFVLDDAGTIAIYGGVISGAHGNVAPIVVRGTIIIDNLTIAGNYHTSSGGVFSVMGGGKVVLNSTTIMNNVTEENGGGISDVSY